jgi:hypothetical protein
MEKPLIPTKAAPDSGPVPRVLFRFAFAYWVLFIVPLPSLWLALGPWVGRHVLHVHASVRYWFQSFPGGGDTTFHYVQVFCVLVLSAAAAAVWTAPDRERRNYERLHDRLRVVVRFFLAAPDLGQLANLFLFNRAVEPAALRPLFARPWLNHVALVLRTGLVATLAGLSLLVSYFHQTYDGDWAPRPPLYGIWDVSEFESDGEVRPPLLTDAARWRRVIVPQEGPLCIELTDDSRRRYALEVDAGRGRSAPDPHSGADPEGRLLLSGAGTGAAGAGGHVRWPAGPGQAPSGRRVADPAR